jgi:hypothetical protein
MVADDHDEDNAVDEGDSIPLSGESHRSVPLHAGQSPARLKVVKRDIDRAYELDVAALLDFAENAAIAPEARLLACARLLAQWEVATESRMSRPVIDLPRIRAAGAGVASRRWQSPTHFCSLLDINDQAAARRRAPKKAARSSGRKKAR